MNDVCLEIDDNKIKIIGDLVFSTVNNLIAPGKKVIDAVSANSEVEIDFEKVDVVDSSALSLIVLWLRHSYITKTKLNLINISPRLIDLARSCGLEEILPYE
ncbi:MAG: STAS domain-containing protein [Francisellaceae bacterium]|jgi:phospholipid transport system transporter-binding protein|nr:STAS domain-containing protein [Francisellaceae bacterium]MBT6206632.1 STAS domain-containing protein [Francisellaceae bacterium]MBT6539459.1 STAS domain-containing protein [Francisellaceae bacterium]